ncbi:MAG: response regulator, partial [Bacteroidales bacterium]|nr:response regulator [Bacteroidales bacterium]
QKQKLTSSINYAKYIQTAVLPPESYIKKILPEHFILFKPKDIVSGDFYWITEKEGVIILAVADCTGHGVPGGFMSMLGIAFLNEIVNKIGINKHIRSLHANEILNQLRDQIIHSLHQSLDKDHPKDGMDVAVVIIDLENRHLQYSGAHNPLYIIRNNEFIQLNPDKMPIGIYRNLNYSFTNHDFNLEYGDKLYLFTDGYYDQLDTSNTRKFLIKNFKSLLLSIQDKPMDEQKDILEEIINEWRGDKEQLDDILIFGFKVTKYIKQHIKGKIKNWESKRILIAEDTDINYFLLVEALKSTGAQIFRAKNGLEAVDFCKNNEVDLVLMDINMPVLNGLEATRQIRDFNKKLPVIAQTAQSQSDDIEKCEEVGCNEYISKPIDLRQFINKIEKHL